MKQSLQISRKLTSNKTSVVAFFALLSLQVLLGTRYLIAQETTSSFVKGTDSLVVFKNVPGLVASDKYTIRVKSALTNNQWEDVFAHKCYNRANELPQDQKTANRLNYHYQYFTADWSHTYGNIEMSKNNPVEVEISLINGFQIDKKDAYKAAAHPAHKVSKQPEVIDGKIYFTISNPGQITIDINGQMDDHHAEINPIGPPPLPDGSQSFPIHTISLFANPILDKPLLTNPNIVFVEPWVKPSSNLGAKTILYFKPGVHNIGRNFTIFANKTYYIPGDAIVYGTFANLSGSGANIIIYGSGTISGKFIHHPNYDPEYTGDDKSWKLIWSVNCVNFKVEGLSLMDTPKHTMNLWTTKTTKIETVCTWLKIVTWRSNGDGIGTADVINDCFLRTGDDASYLKGYERKRIIFWRDVHAAAFHMANMTSNLIEVEDCDVIYNRSRDVIGDNGGIFHQRGEGQPGVQNVNLVVKNFRNEDKLANMPVFHMFSGDAGSSYKGILFQNINVESTVIKQVLEGSAQGPWNGGVTFDNVTFKGVLLTAANFTTYFNTNSYVSNIVFTNTPIAVTLTVNGGKGGTVTGAGSFSGNQQITVTATAAPDYKFDYWKDGNVIVSSDPNYTFNVMKAQKLDAYFSVNTGFNKVIDNKNFTVYPNPCSDILSVDFNDNESERKIQIINNQGQVVYKTNNSDAKAHIDIKSLNLKGIITIQVITDNSAYNQKVIVK